MSISLGAGTLTIEVPDDVTVNLDAEVGAGDLDVFGKKRRSLIQANLGLVDQIAAAAKAGIDLQEILNAIAVIGIQMAALLKYRAKPDGRDPQLL